MVSVISKEKKKPYLLFDKYIPVLLTTKYPEYYEQLIEYALNQQIKLYCRIDITSANGIPVSEDFALTPSQITQVQQEKKKMVTIEIVLPEHLAISNNTKLILATVGIHGLYINSIDADYLVSLIQESQPITISKNIIKNKQQLLSKLKIDENRPSNLSRPKAQKITLELEEIIIDGHIETINLDTLWNCLLRRAHNNLSKRYEKGARDTIKDKETLKEWNREEAYPHTNKVLKWFKSF